MSCISLDASIMAIGEKMKADILEQRKQQQPMEGALQSDLERQRASLKYKSESIASFNDSDDQTVSENFEGGTDHGRCFDGENSEVTDGHTHIENSDSQANAKGQEQNDDDGKQRKEADFDSACAFAYERSHPGFEVWVDEGCEADRT
jgi:hypothetical protein